jgi:hypothetical protein
MECPICYDPIDQTRNCITTECGHQFHAACLMKNACINGFSCPSCRAKMVEQEPEDVPESDSEHIYLNSMWEDSRVRRDDELVRREEDAQQLDEEQNDLLNHEELDQLWEEQREAEFMRSEEEAFERAEQEILRIRGERRRYAELERQREQIEIQNDVIESSLYEHQAGEPVDTNYYDDGNDQQNGDAPSIEYISEQLVARGVKIDDFVSAMLRTNSAYYRSTAEHDRINAIITKHICEIVFEYIMRPQQENAAATELSNDWWEPEE